MPSSIDAYDDSRMHHWQAGQVAGLVDPGTGGRVLDVATGTGLAIRAVADRLDRHAYAVGG